MIPPKKIEEIIKKHSSLEKELSSGEINKKLYAEKSKEYSDLNGIIEEAKSYISFNKNKSELEKILEDTKDDEELKNQWTIEQDKVILACSKAYKWAVENNIAKEQARAVMPEGLTKSRMYMNGTLRSWVHYIELRSSNGTQKEHMEIARECANVIAPIFPLITNYITD